MTKKILIFCLGMMFLLTSCTKASSDEKNVVDTHKAEQQEEQQKEEKEQETEEIEPGIKEEIQTEGEEVEAVQEQPEEPAQTTNGKVVVIDPGHSSVITGETEPIGPGASERKPADAIGTSGTITGIPEYELTLAVSQKLKDELESRGYTVAMTRESSDVPVSCVQRAEVANQLQADVFLRIHANGSESAQAEGAMTICTTPNNPYAPQLYTLSRELSDCIIQEFCTATGCENDGVWETDTMSGSNWSQVPVTIVEMGYMTNPQEDELMATEEYRNKMVQGIANGVDLYLGIGK